jgi:activator of HSP90 ATPase
MTQKSDRSVPGGPILRSAIIITAKRDSKRRSAAGAFNWSWVALAIVGLLIISASAGAAGGRQPFGEPGGAAADSSTSIHQEVDFKASPARVYEALLDGKQFTAFSGFPAEIDRNAGGAFSSFGGAIVGRNVELVPNHRIVQAWRSNGWPEGAYSIVKFELTEQAGGTRLIMDHRGFPDGQREHLEAGWKEHYWEPLAKYLH